MVRRLLLFSLLFTILGGGAAAQAAEPPNQNDPCSRNGRNTCGTNGEGSYRNYRYGIRWFGDYRRVVEEVSGGTFCIDLRFWYPSKSFGYEARSAAGLRNKENESVSALELRRMNRALWRYGRSNNATQQAAVMLYVHRLMADGAPGEADPNALSAASRRIYALLERDAERFAGPYKLRATLPEKLVAGQQAELTVEVVTSSGRKVPGVEVELSATGAEVPESVSTGSSGTVKTIVTATAAGNLSLEARAASLPAELPTLYVPTRGQSVRNAQRIVSAQTARPSVRVQAPVRAQPALSTQISQQVAAPGASITDTVRVSGLGAQPATVQAALYGPYATREAITCTDAPVWTGTLQVTGDGEYVTEPVTLTVPGYYTYRESIAETETIAGVQTACAEVSETTIVRATPSITTQVSAQESTPGSQITDSVIVTGLGKLSATVTAELWGPYPSREAMTCAGTPFWTGTFPAAGDGTYTTAPVTLTQAGYYTYRESIAATEGYDAVVTPCGEVSETTLAKAAPKVTTVVSDAVIRPGAEIFDRLTVSGPRQDAGHGRARAVRPVRLAGGDRLRGRAVLEGQGRGDRGRRVRLAQGHGAPRRLLRLPRTDRRLGARHRTPGRVPRRGRDVAVGAGDPRRARRQRRLRRAGQRRAVAGAAGAARDRRSGLSDRDRPQVGRARHPGEHPPRGLVARRRHPR